MKHANKILGVIIAVMLLVMYGGGYFWFGTKHNTVDSQTGLPVVVRSFLHGWQALIYIPAAMLEDAVVGNGAFSAPE